MVECVAKKVKKVKLCSGDMNDIIDIVRRSIEAPKVGTSSPQTTFTSIAKPWAITETIDLSGSNAKRFEKVNINDRPTHKWLIYYDADLWPLDSENNFIIFDSRRFRIISATDLNEMKETIEILCTERGVDSLEATEA